MVPHYLIHSFLYYEMDHAIISDKLYDTICLDLDREWDAIVHPHKHLIDRGALTAGTGYYLEYPARVQGSATLMLHETINGSLPAPPHHRLGLPL
jgi:hypothetical protein